MLSTFLLLTGLAAFASPTRVRALRCRIALEVYHRAPGRSALPAVTGDARVDHLLGERLRQVPGVENQARLLELSLDLARLLAEFGARADVDATVRHYRERLVRLIYEFDRDEAAAFAREIDAWFDYLAQDLG